MMFDKKAIAFLGACMLALLSGCAAGGQLGASALSDPSGTAANLFGIPAATIAKQMSAELTEIQMVAAQLQMLKAQLDGTLPVLQVPPIVPPVMSTPVTSVPPPPILAPPSVPTEPLAPSFHRRAHRGGTLAPPSEFSYNSDRLLASLRQ